jgi:uncharacterized protein involved in exopolysaccharide biosynthesis
MLPRGERPHYPEDRLLYGLVVVLAIALATGLLAGLLVALARRLS